MFTTLIKTASIYRLIIIANLLFLASCTSTIPSGSYPHPTSRPTPTKPRPVVITKPKPRPVKQPVIKPSIKKPVVKTVTKPPKVVVKAYEPEQGTNPYDNIPSISEVKTSRSSNSSETRDEPADRNSASTDTTSPAVKSLLIQAKAAMLIKRNASAIEKLERALRIEPQNPNIWHQLAKAHFNQKEDASAISMAQKSNLYTDEGSPLEKKNWQLIKAASKRSEDIKSLKAAIQYERANP